MAGYSNWLPDIGLSREAWEVHGVYVPEAVFDLEVEAQRLTDKMDQLGSVNLFISEGAGLETILAELERSGEEVPRDPFGHVKMDKINPGAWFGSKFAERLDARKVMVQKSGYFSRSAPANQRDLELIKSMTDYAVDAALRGEAGLVGHDEERGDELRAIEFDRIRGGKPFDISHLGSRPCWIALASPALSSLLRTDPDQISCGSVRLTTRTRVRHQAPPGCGSGDVASAHPYAYRTRGHSFRYRIRFRMLWFLRSCRRCRCFFDLFLLLLLLLGGRDSLMLCGSDPCGDKQDKLSKEVEEEHEHNHWPKDHRSGIAAKH